MSVEKEKGFDKVMPNGAFQDFIKNVGFPVVVAIILMFQVIPRLDKMQEVLVGLSKGFEVIAKTQDRLVTIQEQYLEYIIEQQRRDK